MNIAMCRPFSLIDPFPPLSPVEKTLWFINGVVCFIFAVSQYETTSNPFFNVCLTFIRVFSYQIIGRLIGRFFPIGGNLTVIGFLSYLLYNKWFL